MVTLNNCLNLVGTIAELGEEQVFTFEGMIGDRILFDSLDTDSPAENITYRVVGPNGETIINNTQDTVDTFTPVTLTETGTYEVIIDGAINATGDYDLNLLKLNLAPTLNFGVTVSDTLEPGTQTDVYRFTGTKGQIIEFDTLVAPGGGTWRLYGPNDEIIDLSSNLAERDSNTPITLTEAGEYELTIDSNFDTGDYNFRLLDVTNAVLDATNPNAIALDEVVTGTLTSGRESDFYAFSGTEGQKLYFDGTFLSGVNWRLYAPDNTTLASGSSLNDFEEVLPVDGTYLLEIEGNSNSSDIDYSFEIVTPTVDTNPLILNAVTTGDIDELGEEDVYTFMGTVGQRLVFDSVDDNTDSITARLISPSGVTVANINPETDFAPITLTETGEYELILDSNAVNGGTGDTGDYAFQLLDVDTGAIDLTPSIGTPGTVVTGTISGGNEIDLYRFTGTAGQRLQFDNLTGSGANWRLYGPDNSFVVSNRNIATDFEVTLPGDGTYVLEIDGLTNSDVGYSFQVNDLSDTAVTPSGFGVVQTGTIAAGQVDTFSYTGNAGQLIYFDSLDDDNDSIRATLSFDGDGTNVFSNISVNDDNGSQFLTSAFVLPRSGDYTLTVQGSNATATGDYDFRILDLADAATPLTLGTAVSQTLADPREIVVYSFTADVGDRILYDSLETTSANDVVVVLLDPSGDPVTGLIRNNSRVDSNPLTLTEGGTYYLLQRGQGTAGADFNFRLLDLDAATAINLDTVVNGTLSGGRESDFYSFTGTAGQQLYFDSPFISGLTWRLFDVNNQQIGVRGNFANFEVTLPGDGTYLLEIEGNSNADVDYSFEIITPDFVSNGLLFNTPTSGTIDELGEEDTFTFTGSIGQRVYFDSLETDFSDNITVRLTNPSGSNVSFNSNPETDVGVFTLTEAGEYELTFDGGSGTGNYDFQLLDVATGATDLTFDTSYSRTLTGGRETDLFRFTGTEGQRLYFNNIDATASNSARWSLYSPTNQLVFNSGFITSDFEATLPGDGEYVLAITGFSNTDVTYEFEVVTPEFVSTALTFGTPVSGNIDELGEEDTYTFTGTVGQKIFFDSLETDFSDTIQARLISPSGVITQIAGSNRAHSDSSSPVTLVEAGEYQVVIDSNGSNSNGGVGDTGDYNFRLLDVTNTTPVNFDQVVNGTLSSGRESDFYSFTGTEGQRLYLKCRMNAPATFFHKILIKISGG